jgi:hypothetical protein
MIKYLFNKNKFYFKNLGIFLSKLIISCCFVNNGYSVFNGIGGVMCGMLTSSVVDCVFEPQSS